METARFPDATARMGSMKSRVPVILDRCHQARVKNALEPEWEARFEPRSFGFRPGRGGWPSTRPKPGSGTSARGLISWDLASAATGTASC